MPKKPMTCAEAGRIGGSKPKRFSEEELAKRRVRMKEARQAKEVLRMRKIIFMSQVHQDQALARNRTESAK